MVSLKSLLRLVAFAVSVIAVSGAALPRADAKMLHKAISASTPAAAVA